MDTISPHLRSYYKLNSSTKWYMIIITNKNLPIIIPRLRTTETDNKMGYPVEYSTTMNSYNRFCTSE